MDLNLPADRQQERRAILDDSDRLRIRLVDLLRFAPSPDRNTVRIFDEAYAAMIQLRTKLAAIPADRL